MKRRCLALGALFLCSFTVPAHANWQWTNWGMTEQELHEKSPIPLLVESDDGTGDRKGNLKSTYHAGNVDYKVTFLVSRSTAMLEGVILRPEAAACAAVEMALVKTYGEPFGKTGYPGLLEQTIWRDTEKGNKVEFMVVNTGECFIEYASIEAKDDSGL